MQVELERLIDRAFRAAQYPGDDALIAPGPDGAYRESLAETWRGRTSGIVDARWLGTHGEDALSFMTPAAIRYYMSSFLRAAVADYAAMDVAIDALVSVLTQIQTGDEYALRHQAIAAAFTAEEAEAIAAVLEWLASTHRDDFAIDDESAVRMREAIRYWNDKGRSQRDGPGSDRARAKSD